MLERIDRRALGAVEAQDGVTGRRLGRPLTVTSETASVIRTRGGLYAIMSAEGLEEHLGAFEAPPAAPPIDSLLAVFRVDDPLGDFLPVLATVALPRSPDPGPGESDLFAPHRAALPSAPVRPLGSGWAAIRVTIRDQADRPVRGALIEILPTGGGDRLGWGLTDRRGEGLAPAPAIPLLREVDATPLDPEDEDEVVTDETPVILTVVADPAQPWPVDPERLSAERASLRSVSLAAPVTLTAGAATHRALSLDLS